MAGPIGNKNAQGHGGTIGNQNAVGNSGGRERIYDREAIAKDLIAWSKQMFSTNLNRFCGDREIVPEYLSVWAKESFEFSQALKIARANIASNREDLLNRGGFHQAAYNRNQRYYDHFECTQWEYEKTLESKLKSEDEKGTINVRITREPWKEHSDTTQIPMPTLSDSSVEGS